MKRGMRRLRTAKRSKTQMVGGSEGRAPPRVDRGLSLVSLVCRCAAVPNAARCAAGGAVAVSFYRGAYRIAKTKGEVSALFPSALRTSSGGAPDVHKTDIHKKRGFDPLCPKKLGVGRGPNFMQLFCFSVISMLGLLPRTEKRMLARPRRLFLRGAESTRNSRDERIRGITETRRWWLRRHSGG